MNTSISCKCSCALHREIEDVLYHEAELLDEWRLEAWMDLLTEDIRYIVPSTDSPSADPDSDMVFINDDFDHLSARITRLSSDFAHAEQPRSRTRRFISNIKSTEQHDNEVFVSASLLVFHFRHGRESTYVGRYNCRIRLMDDEPKKICFRKITLDQESLSQHGAISIVL